MDGRGSPVHIHPSSAVSTLSFTNRRKFLPFVKEAVENSSFCKDVGISNIQMSSEASGFKELTLNQSGPCARVNIFINLQRRTILLI